MVGYWPRFSALVRMSVQIEVVVIAIRGIILTNRQKVHCFFVHNVGVILLE
jgi:hypothetical protein